MGKDRPVITFTMEFEIITLLKRQLPLFANKTSLSHVTIDSNYNTKRKPKREKNAWRLGSEFKTQNYGLVRNICIQVWNKNIRINLKT
jgi:hypothetical protein